MDTTLKLLQSYWGRDKIIRTISYACMLGAGNLKGKNAVRLGTIAAEISKARTVLRLFDDVLLIKYTTTYGLGKQERDPVYRILQIFNNLADTIFFPVEHISWLGEYKIIPWDPSKWSVACLGVWATSLSLSILRCMRRMAVNKYRIARLIKQRKLESPEKSDEALKDEIRSLRVQQMADLLTLIKSAFDLMNAINWLPPGFLWSGKFSTAYAGFFGMVSSVVGLYLTVVASKAKNS